MRLPKKGLYESVHNDSMIEVINIIPFFGFVHMIQSDGGIVLLYPIKLLKITHEYIGEV